MNSIQSYLTVIITCGLISVSTSSSDPHKLTAVSHYKIAEALYRRIRNENPPISEPPALNADIKNRICFHITGSTYFTHVLGEERVFMPSMGTKLRKKEPTVFADLFKRSDDPGAGEDFVYTNLIRPTNVYITEDDDKTVEEYVFTCLTISGPEMYIYYVSREYNLADDSTSYIAGRFLFGHNVDDKSRIEIFNVAEQPARSLLPRGAEAERSYLQSRTGNKPAQNKSDDPVCKLNKYQRVRLCTLILSSTCFEGELRFNPRTVYDEEMDCTKLNIWFQDAQVKSEGQEKHYEEWMIACRPEEYYASFQAEYFISRVYNSESEVFVYHRGRDLKSVIVENRFGDVRFRI